MSLQGRPAKTKTKKTALHISGLVFVYFIAIGYCCSTLSSSVPWFSGVCTVPFWTERTSCYLMVNFEFGASQTLTLASHFLVLKQILYFHIVVKSSDK